jgi:hypothetical protein
LGQYFQCIFCGRVAELGYGQTYAQCPGCGAVYAVTDVPPSSNVPVYKVNVDHSYISNVPGASGGFFGFPGHSGEGWYLLGGAIIGFVIGWPVSRAVLSSAIGLTADEINRRAREVASRAEAKARELATTAQARIQARRR